MPGLGTYMARRRVSGALQLVVSQAGFLLMVIWMISYVAEWAQTGELPIDMGSHMGLGLLGVALFLLAWIWSLASSVDVLLSSGKRDS